MEGEQGWRDRVEKKIENTRRSTAVRDKWERMDGKETKSNP